jgi:aminomethyltransferase
MFDVSHMVVVDITGIDSKAYLQRLLANDVSRLEGRQGKALYSAMLNDNGGVIDDLIVYDLEEGYRLILNCANGIKDLQWMRKVANAFTVAIQHQSHLSLLAVQGPSAVSVLCKVFSDHAALLSTLPYYTSLSFDNYFVARTGYTGEDGFEVMAPHDKVEALWQSLAILNVQPCGLGARDTLRIEAGFNLYGHEMDETVSPLSANMEWTVAWEPSERHFIGREALQQQKALGSPRQQLVGLVMKERGVLRAQQTVQLPDSADFGTITSGTFSPSLGMSIALARLPHRDPNSAANTCSVELRNKTVSVRIVSPKFVRHGKSLLDKAEVPG